MEKSDPRRQALKRLCQPDPLQKKLAVFSSHRDRALYQELVRGVIRNRLLLDWYIKQYSDQPLEKLSPRVLNTLRLGLYQIFFMRTPDHAAVSESVELLARNGKGKAKSYINATLRTILRARDQGKLPSPKPFDWKLRFSYPEFLFEHLKEAYGWAYESQENFGDLLKALNRPLPICLRVNRLKITRETLLQKLKDFDPELQIEKTKWSPDGLNLSASRDLTQLPGFPEGEFLVQSESSQIISYLLFPLSAEMRILDACAAPGGKTTHMAELQNDQGEIIALAPTRKQSKKGNARLQENIKRLGLHSIKIIKKTAQEFAKNCPLQSFDRILVDAPCTGLGTLAKNPERKWYFQKKHVEKLLKQQKEILNAVFPLLKKDGILVYSICSISLPEWQVGLGRNLLDPPTPANIPWHLIYNRNRSGFIFWPHKMYSEGFFAARLR